MEERTFNFKIKESSANIIIFALKKMNVTVEESVQILNLINDLQAQAEREIRSEKIACELNESEQGKIPNKKTNGK